MREGERTALIEQMRSAGRRALFEVPFTRRGEGNELRSRADTRLVRSSRSVEQAASTLPPSKEEISYTLNLKYTTSASLMT